MAAGVRRRKVVSRHPDAVFDQRGRAAREAFHDASEAMMPCE
jgi:hypothetical protein